MRYPERLLTDDEDILRQFRPHWRVLLPVLAWAMAFAALGGIAFAALERPWREVAIAAAVVLWLLLSTRPLFDWWFTNYVLTTERIVVRRGMIARTGTEIPLEQITNVLFSQTVMERLLGYGDVILEAAGSQGRSELHDIPDPEGFQQQVYEARELRNLHYRGGGEPRALDPISALERLADLRERGHLTPRSSSAASDGCSTRADAAGRRPTSYPEPPSTAPGTSRTGTSDPASRVLMRLAMLRVQGPGGHRCSGSAPPTRSGPS
jgi:membrane protein YdbS with pleckstrin-like domain